MAVVEHNSDYYGRLLKELNDQETLLDSLNAEIQGLQQKHDEQRAKLEEYIGGLNLGSGDQPEQATTRPKG
jgi:peptidoglycan hydrolase CwlO-like protein